MRPSPAFDPLFLRYLDRWGAVPDGKEIVTHSSRLLPVTWRGKALMLKVATAAEEKHGNACLAAWGHGPFAPVYAQEGDAVLMERATPAPDLTEMSQGGRDNEAIEILVEAASGIHTVPAPDVALIQLAERFASVEAAPDEELFNLANRVASDLLSNPVDQSPLHGDIHHGNVLYFENSGWRAIDPKGLQGERGFDYANILCNPDTDTALSRFEPRIQQIASRATLDPERLLKWCVAWCGLSAVWTLQDGGDPTAARNIGLKAAQMSQTIRNP